MISVIVPIYNAEKYLKKCIHSILNQSFSKFELILVNDGSMDKSGEICARFAQSDKRVRVIHKENKGATCARKSGIDVAKYDYISFIDADDWVEENFLERLINEILFTKADIIISGCVNEQDGVNAKVINRIVPGIYEGEQLTSFFYSKMLCFEGFYQFGIQPYMWNKLFRTEMLKECYKEIDLRIYDGEDAAVIYPYLLSAKRVTVIDDCLYHYQRHKGSVSYEKSMDFYENVSRLYLYLYQEFQKSKYCTILIPQLNQYMQRMIWFGMPEGFMREAWNYFPYREIPCGSSIILYGAGKVGKNYYHHIKKTDFCRIVSWVDRNWRNLSKQEFYIESPDIIKVKEYDYVVVANANAEIRSEIKSFLLKMGVKREKIITGDDNG